MNFKEEFQIYIGGCKYPTKLQKIWWFFTRPAGFTSRLISFRRYKAYKNSTKVLEELCKQPPALLNLVKRDTRFAGTYIHAPVYKDGIWK